MWAARSNPPLGGGEVGRSVYLTFDAEHPNRPHRRDDSVERLLDVLDRHAVKGTFFLQGRWVPAYPGTATRIVEAGHTIGSHSNAHVRMSRLSDEGIEAEVGEAESRIKQVTGVNPKPYFRCPYGDGHDDTRVTSVIDRLGYRVVGWDVDPQDWNEARSAEEVAASIDTALAEADSSSIVLLHTWPAWTPTVVDQVLTTLSERMHFAPLD